MSIPVWVRDIRLAFSPHLPLHTDAPLLARVYQFCYKQPMLWRVEILNETVAEELDALPVDMRARLARIVELT